MKRTPISSSALRSVGHDFERNVLEIEFTSGSIYRYFDVPAWVYEELMAAPSPGRYFDEHLRNAGYVFERVES